MAKALDVCVDLNMITVQYEARSFSGLCILGDSSANRFILFTLIKSEKSVNGIYTNNLKALLLNKFNGNLPVYKNHFICLLKIEKSKDKTSTYCPKSAFDSNEAEKCFFVVKMLSN